MNQGYSGRPTDADAESRINNTLLSVETTDVR